MRRGHDAAVAPWHATSILTHRHEDGKMDGWSSEGREKEGERNMPKHNDDSKTRQVTLCRHVASPQFLLFQSFPAFTKHGNLGSGLALSFLLSLFQIVIGGLGVVRFMAALSPGLTPASTGSGWCVNAMREGLVWEVRALKSNFPGFLSEPGEDSPDEKIK